MQPASGSRLQGSACPSKQHLTSPPQAQRVRGTQRNLAGRAWPGRTPGSPAAGGRALSGPGSSAAECCFARGSSARAARKCTLAWSSALGVCCWNACSPCTHKVFVSRKIQSRAELAGPVQRFEHLQPLHAPDTREIGDRLLCLHPEP